MRAVWRIAVVAGAMGLVAIRVHAARQTTADELRQAAATLPTEEAAARAAGLPLTVEELLRLRPSLEGEPAAPLYQEFDRQWLAGPGADEQRWRGLVRLIEGAATEAERRQARETLAQWGDRLRLAERAAALPRCGPTTDWSKLPGGAAVPHMGLLKAARLLVARAILDADDGHYADAFGRLRAAAAVARHAGEDPTVLNLVVSAGVGAIADGGLKQVLRRHGTKSEVLRLARETHGAISPRLDMGYALRGEAVFVRAGIRDPRRVLREVEWDPKSAAERRADRALARQPTDLLRRAFDARTLSFYRQLLAAIEGAGPDIRAQSRALDAVCRAAAKRKEPSYRVVREVAPQMRCGPTVQRAVARERLRAAGIALLETRQRTGAFPDALPEPLQDPFDGKPLRYRRTADGFVVYSIGMDLKDDGGHAPARGEAKDVAFVYP